MAESEIWEPKQLEAEQTAAIRLGPLHLYLRRVGDDWLVASQTTGENVSGIEFDHSPKLSKDLGWHRWAFNATHDQFFLRPVMPDRPVVVRPRNVLTLPPSTEIVFFVSIPIWVRIYLGDPAHQRLATVLDTFPSGNLSETWFGDFSDGELSYALRSFAFRRLSSFGNYPHRAICPVVIRNRSEEPIFCHKLCVRAQYLNLYRDKDRLWTNQVTVYHRGDDELSQIKYKKSPPVQADNPILLHEADLKAPDTNFLQRTFSTLTFHKHT